MRAILHNIRSLYNVGSIFRTADGVGIEKLYLCGITPAPLDRFGKKRAQLTKVSLGAEDFVAWEKCVQTGRLIDRLKGEGFKIVAVEQDERAISLGKLKWIPHQVRDDSIGVRDDSAVVRDDSADVCDDSIGVQDDINRVLDDCERVVLVVGSEVKGLPKSILDKCDLIIEIPMRGKKESLNVAVAFGIVAYAMFSKV